MCIFCSNFGRRLLESNSYLAMLERIFQHSPEITVAKCSPYYSTLVLFQKTVTPFAIAFRSTIMNEFLLCCEMLFQIDKSIFFEKKHVLLAYVRAEP